MQAPPLLWDVDPSAPPDAVYFPVRHYSPTSARLLLDCARAVRPTAVLIEGPAHFNDRFDELAYDHVLPIALYAYAELSDGTHRSAFYPYSVYAPEWQATLVARELGIPARFIDLPWPEMAVEATREHRYSDDNFRVNPYPEALAERLNVESFDELWDVLFELDATLSWRDYLKRAHEFCWQLRLFSGASSAENTARERCMARHIDEALAEFGGPVLVVTGGFHSSGIWALRAGVDLPLVEVDTPDEPPTPHHPEEVLQQLLDDEAPEVHVVSDGITLTPFTYARLDALSGNAAGVHGPAFYHDVWTRRLQNQPLDGRHFIHEIIATLRELRQRVSTADAIAIESAARAFATLRGREDVWRFDLVDAVAAALIKEPQSLDVEHPVLAATRRVLRGERRGVVDPRTPLPPIVAHARETLRAHDLLPSDDARVVELDFDEPDDREKSRVLHRCRVLGLSGFRRLDGTDFVARDDLSAVWEDWELVWTPEFEATLIEAATYGVTLRDAAVARIHARAASEELDAVDGAKLAIDAVLLGAGPLATALLQRLAVTFGEESDFYVAARALGHILYLYAYDEVLETRRDEALRALMREAYLRTLWLFESLGASRDRMAELVGGVKQIVSAFVRCYADDAHDRAELVALFERTVRDETHMPTARGAATGGLCSLGALDTERVLAAMYAFRDPIELGDFLTGVFSLAREPALRDARLLQLVDAVVCGLTEEQFLEMVPAMRLAFTFFTPREKHKIVGLLFAERDAPPAADTRDRDEGAALDAKLREVVRAFALRPHLPASTAPSAEQPVAGQTPAAAARTGDLQALIDRGAGELDPETRRARWRLILSADAMDDRAGAGGDGERRDELLAFLYDREYQRRRNVRRRRGRGHAGSSTQGSLGRSQLTIPEWINAIHELFPKRTIERLERDALERYKVQELVTQPDVLARATPNATLLKAVLRTKHLMSAEVLALARTVVRRVVDELLAKLSREVAQPFSGARNRRRSRMKIAKNFDARETIRRNLKYYDTARRVLAVRDPYFTSRVRRQSDRWQLIIVVDQSGSMLDNVIHAAVMASVFHQIRSLRMHLIAFDTNIVDLTEDVGDPVEMLMRVQLGGGTDIGNALSYAQTRIVAPRRAIVVLITDFFEGSSPERLLAVTRSLVESGATLLGLAALDQDANPNYDRELAGQLVALGAHVGAMTPGELAAWVAEKIR